MKKKKLLTLIGSICLTLVLAALLLPACAPATPEEAAEEIAKLEDELAAEKAKVKDLKGEVSDLEKKLAEAEAAAPTKAEYKWRCASPFSDKTRNDSIALFCDLVGVYSDGRIEVEFYPDGVLGPHDETFHAVREGSVEIGRFGPYTNLVPGGMINYMPWTVGSFDEAAIAFTYPDGILYRVMGDAWDEVDCHLLWCMSTGAYGLGNNVRPIRTPDDFKNLKFRVSAAESFVMALKNMGEGTGLTLQTLPWVEVYGALERGVMDGVWSIWTCLVEERQMEVLQYYTHLSFAWDADNVVINKQLWEELPLDLQDVVLRASTMAEERGSEACRRNDLGFRKIVADAGVEIYYPTPEERELFREKANMPAIWEELAKTWLDKRYPGQNMTQTILDELARISAEVGGYKP